MTPLNGIQLPKLGFSLKKMGDFLFHEGPVQSHFINEKNEDFLFFWADADAEFNRWMVVKSTPELLHRFFSGEINTRDLISLNPDGFVYFLEIDGAGAWKRIFLVANKDIPHDYFPSEDSFYLPAHYESYAHELKAYLDNLFSRREKFYSQTEPAPTLVNEPLTPYNRKM